MPTTRRPPPSGQPCYRRGVARQPRPAVGRPTRGAGRARVRGRLVLAPMSVVATPPLPPIRLARKGIESIPAETAALLPQGCRTSRTFRRTLRPARVTPQPVPRFPPARNRVPGRLAPAVVRTFSRSTLAAIPATILAAIPAGCPLTPARRPRRISATSLRAIDRVVQATLDPSGIVVLVRVCCHRPIKERSATRRRVIAAVGRWEHSGVSPTSLMGQPRGWGRIQPTGGVKPSRREGP